MWDGHRSRFTSHPQQQLEDNKQKHFRSNQTFFKGIFLTLTPASRGSNNKLLLLQCSTKGQSSSKTIKYNLHDVAEQRSNTRGNMKITLSRKTTDESCKNRCNKEVNYENSLLPGILCVHFDKREYQVSENQILRSTTSVKVLVLSVNAGFQHPQSDDFACWSWFLRSIGGGNWSYSSTSVSWSRACLATVWKACSTLMLSLAEHS